MKLGVTGHRPKDLGGEHDGYGPYSNYGRKMGQKYIDLLQPEQGISGMAEGWDKVFAKLCIANNIPLLALVPFEGQQRLWSDDSKKEYFEILNHPLTTVINVSGQTAERDTPFWQLADWFQKRNERIIDELMLEPENPGVLLPYWNGKENGGTWNCIKYARKKMQKEQIIYIDPKEALK